MACLSKPTQCQHLRWEVACSDVAKHFVLRIDIVKRSMAEKRVVISKDFDFYDRFFRKLEPYKLLYISTGNIPNQQLLNIFQSNLPKISEALDTGFVIEITRSSIIVID